MPWDRLFPFDPRRGELVDYEDNYSPKDRERRTLDQARFTGELTYHTYSRGRSSALLIFTDGTLVPYGPPSLNHDPTPRKFPFFMSNADVIIPKLVHGKISGTFIPTKKGANFAWALEEEK